MTRWIFSACLFALAASPAAAADVRLDSYRNPDNQSLRDFHHAYLDGVRTGLIMYNLWVKNHGGQPAFCLKPEDFPITTEKTEEIMLKSADKHAAKGDVLIAMPLLYGMRDAFPCEKPDGQ
jgi:hypothetical protein